MHLFRKAFALRQKFQTGAVSFQAVLLQPSQAVVSPWFTWPGEQDFRAEPDSLLAQSALQNVSRLSRVWS
jgi:hypothetical protein